jgi:hypothetical protein
MSVEYRRGDISLLTIQRSGTNNDAACKSALRLTQSWRHFGLPEPWPRRHFPRQAQVWCDPAHISRARKFVAFICQAENELTLAATKIRLLVGDQRKKERQMKKTALIVATVAAFAATAATAPAQARGFGFGAGVAVAAAVAAGVAADTYGYGYGPRYGYYGRPVYYGYGAPVYYGGWYHGYRHYW